MFLMLIRIVFFSFVLYLLYSGCKTSQNNQSPATPVVPLISDGPRYTSTDTFYRVKQRLSGDWIWLKTECCGRIKNVSTPESTKNKIEKKFSTDGTVTTINNGKTESALGYQILFSYLNDNNYMISVDDGRPGLLHFFGDTLVIDYGYVDLQTEWYLRKK
jgi:hypothetical protein